MYIIKDFCEKSLKNLKGGDLHSFRNIFLSYALCGSYMKDPDYKEKINKINYHFRRYLLFQKQRDYLELNNSLNGCLELINRTLSILESEQPKISSYETVNRKDIRGFFAVKVVS